MADQDLSVPQLSALLEDTQASLAAAFARVETYRLQNRQLRDELSRLRGQALSGGGDASSEGPNGKRMPASGVCSVSFPQASTSGVGFNSVRNGAVYVSQLSGQYPVAILNGGKKVRIASNS